MSAADVVAQVIRAGYQTSAPYGMIAGDVVRALKKAGFAVVELPKPNACGEWKITPGINHPFVYHDSGFDEIWYGSTVIRRQDARAVAAALLAAADAADKADQS